MLATTGTSGCAYLQHAVRVLGAIAPVRWAGKWDNVGLLVDASVPFAPAPPAPSPHPLYHLYLTNDLTPAVLEDAVAVGANLIVTYHPTPFSAMKTFPNSKHASRVVLTCARHGIAVYSPHTALDVVVGGINDWLVDGICARLPLGGGDATAGAGASSLDGVVRSPVKRSDDPDAAAAGVGDGRKVVLPVAVNLWHVVTAVKAHLALQHVHVALPSRLLSAVRAGASSVAAAAATVPVTSMAVCAGSGSSVLAGTPVSVYITGEMSHHDVLAANADGIAVVLTHHTNCERGYLPLLADKIAAAWTSTAASMAGDASTTPHPPPPGDVKITVSAVDADPLTTV